MSSDGKPARRLRMLLGGHAPGVEELDALLRGVDELRLTLETDLALAASAVEAGAPGLAAEIIDSDRDALARFEEDALGSLSALSQSPSRRSRLVHHTAPAVAAAALVAVLAGLMPHNVGARPAEVATSTVAATDSLALIQDLVAQGDEQRVRIASATLHRQLAAVVSRAKSDPLAAQQALLILSYEQSAIVSHGGSDVLADVLVKSRQLAQAIRAALPKSVRTAVPAVPGDRHPRPQPSSSPAPKATSSPKATTTQKPSPKPSSSPAPSSTSSPSRDGGFIPPAPNLNGD